MLEVYKNPFIWRKKVDLKDAGRLRTEERGAEQGREDRQPHGGAWSEGRQEIGRLPEGNIWVGAGGRRCDVHPRSPLQE